MTIRKLVLIGCILSSILPSTAQSVKIDVSGDTYIESSSKDDSFWNDELLRIKHSLSASAERSAWLKFPTSTVPATYEQVLLQLIKTKGDEGNISITAASPNFNENSTWNNPPTQTDLFLYGGLRSGDTCYLDVTDYFKNHFTNEEEIAFKLFTTSSIVSPISFASSENEEIEVRPQLLFYANQRYDIPVFSLYESVAIETENGTLQGEVLSKLTGSEERNEYGGWLGGSSTASGYFRIEKDCEDTWHIIDPLGNLFYSAGINSVEKGGDVSLPNDLIDIGLNTMGSWADESIENFAYCPRFNVLVNFKNTDEATKAVYEQEILPVFEPTFASFCATLAAEELPQYANDPWVLGFFMDNELVFHKNQLSLSLALDTDNAQYKAADAYMKTTYGSTYTLNNISDQDEEIYQGYVAETYFKTVAEAFRAVDPHHMLIGTRFHGGAKYIPGVLEAAGRYVDVVTVNYYNRFEPEEDAMAMWIESANKPFIITEFYVKGEDSGLGNEDGAGWAVATQNDRANWYENWMLKLLRSKGNVGFHWFRYNDKIGNDANKGLYTSDYIRYEELAASMAKVSTSIYSLRSQILYGNSNYNDVIDCNKNLCGNETDCKIVLSDQSTSYALTNSVFPNPVGDMLYIKAQKGDVLEIINNLGEVIHTALLSTQHHEINMSGYHAGLYILQLSNQDTSSSTKLIKL